MQPYVAYYRVSTAMQGKSGLGLEAQRAACAAYHAIAEFIEVESGANNERTQLAAAMEYARANAATLVFAKLDRLSRNAAFILTLMEKGVRIRCADMPDADEFQLHLYAILAHKERAMISARTKEAIAAKRAKGAAWGTNAASVERADAFAADIQRHIKTLTDAGTTSMSAIAKELNRSGIRTAKGGSWSVVQVQRVMRRSG